MRHRFYLIGAMKKLGVFDPYSYDINELILRRKLLKEEGGSDFFSAIYNAEQVGKAIPITLYNDYEQYTNKYGFKSAFFIGLGYLKLYVEELFEPGTLLEALTMTGKIFAKSAKSFKAFKGKTIDEVIGGVAIRKLDDLLSEYPNFNKFKSLDEVAQARISKELEEIGQTEGKLAALNDDLGVENIGDDLVRFFDGNVGGVKSWDGLYSSPNLRKNLVALTEGNYLLGKEFTNADLNGFATFVDNAFLGIKNTLTTRINGSNGFSLIHTDAEIQAILLRAKSLNLPSGEIDDLLFVSCRSAKEINATKLTQQMDNWVNTVQRQRYPYRFTDINQFSQFKNELKSGLGNIGISNSDVRVQGSALRSPDAQDIDLVSIVTRSEFDNFVKAKYNDNILKNGVKVNISNMTTAELKVLADDIGLNRSLYNRKAYDDFRYTINSQIINAKGSKNIISGFKNLRNNIRINYPNLNVENIAIQPSGSGFDLKPFLKL